MITRNKPDLSRGLIPQLSAMRLATCFPVVLAPPISRNSSYTGLKIIVMSKTPLSGSPFTIAFSKHSPQASDLSLESSAAALCSAKKLSVVSKQRWFASATLWTSLRSGKSKQAKNHPSERIRLGNMMFDPRQLIHSIDFWQQYNTALHC